jgi:hypothetical protein
MLAVFRETRTVTSAATSSGSAIWCEAIPNCSGRAASSCSWEMPYAAGQHVSGPALLELAAQPGVGPIDLVTSDPAGARAAVERSLDRWHVFVPDGHPEVLAAMEVYARAAWGAYLKVPRSCLPGKQAFVSCAASDSMRSPETGYGGTGSVGSLTATSWRVRAAPVDRSVVAN